MTSPRWVMTMAKKGSPFDRAMDKMARGFPGGRGGEEMPERGGKPSKGKGEGFERAFANAKRKSKKGRK